VNRTGPLTGINARETMYRIVGAFFILELITVAPVFAVDCPKPFQMSPYGPWNILKDKPKKTKPIGISITVVDPSDKNSQTAISIRYPTDGGTDYYPVFEGTQQSALMFRSGYCGDDWVEKYWPGEPNGPLFNDLPTVPSWLSPGDAPPPGIDAPRAAVLAPASGQASQDFVLGDFNRDGNLDGASIGTSGVVVELLAADGSLLSSRRRQ